MKFKLFIKVKIFLNTILRKGPEKSQNIFFNLKNVDYETSIEHSGTLEKSETD